MLKSITYSSSNPGIQFLVTGAVHGNEKCGTYAINRLITDIDAGRLPILAGAVTFLPICNPRAYERNIRYTERNLNRYLVPLDPPTSYEAELGNILCPLLASCDALLDIHSYTAGGDPFLVIGPHNTREYAFAASLGDFMALTGWQEAYDASKHTKLSTTALDAEESTGTTEYARRHGAIAVTLECGQHMDEHAPSVAYEAVRNALQFLGITHKTENHPHRAPSHLVTVKQVVYRMDAGHLVKPWKHLEPVPKGTTIAQLENGSFLRAPYDCLIIMPREQAAIGDEWFHIGTLNSEQ